MEGKQILILEDEKPIRDMVAFGLRRSGFEVLEAEDCAEARARIADRFPDLALVDWMLPDMSGLEFTRWLKNNESTRDLPVILLTARAEEEDKVRGLECGADDYVTKPFSPRELMARINAVLRRSGNGEEEVVAVEGLELDAASHRVRADGNEVSLGPTEFRLLRFFMTHRERVYSRDRTRGGTGLGLAIVKHVLNRHGARLDIVSELGSGSTFACHFPTARIHAVEAECGEKDTPMAGSTGGG